MINRGEKKWSPTGKALYRAGAGRLRGTLINAVWGDIPACGRQAGHTMAHSLGPKAVLARRSACLRRNDSCRQALQHAGVVFGCRDEGQNFL
jgi:hypothetical protein